MSSNSKSCSINSPRVQVLLSTFNGATYLQSLMDSLRSQDYPFLDILVRDDGSSDGTVNLLQEYATHNTNIKITCGENLGFVQSFFKLFKLADPKADYFALCDQDDIWQPDKLSRAIKFLQQCPPSLPTLYCSRLKVVDENLKRISDSPLPNKGLSFSNALVECPLQGCTMVLNRAGYRLFHKFPQQAYSHDWWIYLVISAIGQVIYDREARILYRQHDCNLFGVPNNILAGLKIKFTRFLSQGKQQPITHQAREFSRIYRALLSDDCQKMLDAFLESRKLGWKRFHYILLGNVYRQSNFDNLVLKGLLLLNRL